MIHSKRATAALQALTEADPALAALSLWCHHRDADAGDTPAWTDGKTVFYTAAFDPLPLHDQTGLAAHQILHIAFRHAPRARAMYARLGDRFDADLYTIACDAILNQMLHQAGHTLPRPYVILTELLEHAFGETEAAGDAIATYDADRLYIRLMQGPQGNTGMTAADTARAYAAAQGFTNDLDPARTGDTDESSPDAADWRQHLIRALDAGRLAGRGLGTLTQIADLPYPRTPWETILRGLVTRAVTRAPRQSHQRPARRWLALDSAARAHGTPDPAFEPGITHDTRTPRIALCIDASSSIDDALLARFLAQIQAIAKRTGAETHVLIFDEVTRSHTVADPARLTVPDIPRGGGTDYADVLTRATALAPSIIVILTDLDAALPPKPGATPVLWAVPDDTRVQPPPYGSLIALSR